MADLQTTVKFNGTLMTTNSAGGGSVLPDPTSIEFVAQSRIERQVYTIPGNSGVKTFNPGDDGFVGIDFFKIEVLNVNKSVRLKFNGDPVGMEIKPVQATGKAFLIGTTNFTTLDIINSDPAAIQVMISAFEKYNV